ncbi:hypothetical protein GCM10007939_06270 [Amylibacter marinus]|uniref:thioredoxin-dependent peroxiredoxin n=1 Tax=Amylibacter marinus TaxID=1475483 RepID=A0ABQ5VSN8_9RHOB|nr:peroxiredoxin [Amylibacter marinus]GLQ34344.1 hypothetical protein GCM10007939_06270 [Amylibacter marinus]
MIKVGEKAPIFSLPDASGQTIQPSETGRGYILFFYPRDNTSGCTKEAIGFSEQLQTFADLGFDIYGISKDSIKSHARFVEKQDLSVSLLSDEHDTLCETFGVWKEKSMYGKTFMGIERSTFLIMANGTIANIWRKVRVKDHVEAVLDAAKAV